MLTTEPQRVLVAVQDDAAREALMENLAADGHDPRGASSLGHTRSHLKQQVDLLLVDLGTDTVHLIDVIRGGRCPTADEWLPIIAGSASSDLFQPVRLLERGPAGGYRSAPRRSPVVGALTTGSRAHSACHA